jgi:peptidoglycan/LPS O-acetylase OafA/YrhL
MANDPAAQGLPAQDQAATAHIPALDALRAIAALCVLSYHLWVHGVDFGPLTPLVAGGSVGTTMFFVLSGYLLYEPFLRGPVDIRAYLIRRGFRIMPAYLLALVGLTLLTGDRSFANAPVTYALLLQNYDRTLFQNFVGPAWTLQLEVTFYLLLPLIAIALARWLRPDVGRPAFVLYMLGIVSLFLGFGALIGFPGPLGVWLSCLFPAMFWGFVPGMALAVVAVRRPDALHQLGKPPLAVTGIVMLLAGLFVNFGYGNVLTAAGTVLLIAAALQLRRSTSSVRLLALAGGTLSYPFYLWHADVTSWLARSGFQGWLLAAGVVLMAGGISVASYLIVERPAMRFGRRITTRGRRSAAADLMQPVGPALHGAPSPSVSSST